MNISFDQGVKEYTLNETVTVYFNPTDAEFVRKFFDAFERLDKKQQEYQEALKGETDGHRIFDIAKEMDAGMRDIINEAFGEDICTPLFGKMSVYAIANGLPVWANLMLAIIDVIDDAINEEKQLADPRLQKYVAKYSKKAGK